MMTKEQIKIYLKRLGISEIHYPSKEFLFELHKAHIERISWQSLDIFAGKPSSIDYLDSVQLMTSKRSGYCFHLNGAFSVLLSSLGYQVKLHRAGVQSQGTDPRVDSFHVGLTVSLPEETKQSQKWIIDVGLGDMPYEPIPLMSGIYNQEPFTYKVAESGVILNGWRLVHDPLAHFTGVDYDPFEVSGIEEFKSKHEHLSKSPDSIWKNLFLVRHRHANGSNELRGCLFSQRNREGITKTEVNKKSLWVEILGDVFRESLCAYNKQEQDELWSKVKRTHEEWKKNQHT